MSRVGKYFPAGIFNDPNLNREFQDVSRAINETPDLWDDLRFPSTAINPPGAASDPDRESSSGLLLFAASGTELIYALVQMPHAWKEQSELGPHIHWQKTTSAAGDVVWRVEYKMAPINEVMDGSWTALTDENTTVGGTPDTDTADKHLITAFDMIDMTGRQISDCILFRVSRIGSDGNDTYGADARMLEFDIHYITDIPGGSTEEYVKHVGDNII